MQIGFNTKSNARVSTFAWQEKSGKSAASNSCNRSLTTWPVSHSIPVSVHMSVRGCCKPCLRQAEVPVGSLPVLAVAPRGRLGSQKTQWQATSCVGVMELRGLEVAAAEFWVAGCKNVSKQDLDLATYSLWPPLVARWPAGCKHDPDRQRCPD